MLTHTTYQVTEDNSTIAEVYEYTTNDDVYVTADELPPEIFALLTQKMFPVWKTEDTNIARFVRGFEPLKAYTKKEFDDYCDLVSIPRDHDLLQYLVKTEEDFSILYPELLSAFLRYFP